MISAEECTQRVMKAISVGVPMDLAKITPESTIEELGLESLDILNVVFALEDEFGIMMPQEMEAGIKSISEIVERVMAEVNKPTTKPSQKAGSESAQ